MSDTKIGNLPVNPGIAVNNQNQPKALDQGKRIDDRQYIPQKYKEVAANMEQQFAEMMVEQMSRTVDEADTEGDGASMDFYKSLEKTERAKALSEQNNLGLQDMILNQIYPKRLRNEMALKQYEAQMGSRIHHNLPSYKMDKKIDTIEMGKNDSTPVPDGTAPVKTQESGGLE